MHTNEVFNALICINNYVNLCINCMLSVSYSRSIVHIRDYIGMINIDKVPCVGNIIPLASRPWVIAWHLMC